MAEAQQNQIKNFEVWILSMILTEIFLKIDSCNKKCVQELENAWNSHNFQCLQPESTGYLLLGYESRQTFIENAKIVTHFQMKITLLSI